jgi:iron complex transport system substrate-binding protein
MLSAAPLAAAPRVVSLDQCADQYVLALSPRAAIAGLSGRALHADSYLRAAARGLPRRRADSESVLAARPAVVVRYWGGSPAMVADLARRGVRVVTIAEATDFAGVRADIRAVAAALRARPAGEALIARMDAKLAAAAGAGRGAAALYLTPGGDTAGRGTLVGAMLAAAGLRNLAPGQGYGRVSLERLTLQPPPLLVLGFFDADLAAGQRWSLGRQEPVRRLIARTPHVSLPGAILGCPAWFAADGVAALARFARARHGA